MADYRKQQPTGRLSKGEIGEIMGGPPSAPQNGNDDDADDKDEYQSNCADCRSGNVANTNIETANVNGGKGVMVTQRHHDKPRGKDEGYKEPDTHKHIFTDHNSFANHFKGHFQGQAQAQPQSGGNSVSPKY